LISKSTATGILSSKKRPEFKFKNLPELRNYNLDPIFTIDINNHYVPNIKNRFISHPFGSILAATIYAKRTRLLILDYEDLEQNIASVKSFLSDFENQTEPFTFPLLLKKTSWTSLWPKDSYSEYISSIDKDFIKSPETLWNEILGN